MIRNSKNSLKQLGLFSFFILAFFSSCKKPDSTGGIDLLPPEDELSAFQSDDYSLEVKVYEDDSIRTDELSSSMLGSYIDPVFGSTTMGIYTQLRMSTSSESFPTEIEIDSVVLALVYSEVVDPYGGVSRQGFSVYEIDEELYLDSTYYSQHRTAIKNRNWISAQGQYQTPNLDEDVAVGEDTLAPQLRLPLDKELGLHLLNPTVSGALDDNDAFQDYFKGIFIEAETRNAGIINYDLVDPDSKVTVYYRDLSGDEPDTTSYDFLITSDCARYTYVQRIYTGPLAALDPVNPMDGSQLLYVQSTGGILSTIDFPDLENTPEATINQARLIIPFEKDFRYRPHDKLFILYKNEDGEYTTMPDETLGTIGGTVDLVNGHVVFDISRYIQKRLSGDIAAGPLYLLSSSAGVTANRMVLHGPAFSTDKKENMRLVITYSN
ncbi:MAG: hypothetical protein RLZZ77_1491 [Bacteroidota bacterium]